MLATILATGILPISPLEFRAETTIDDRYVTLDAVADLQNLPADIRTDARQLILYRLAERQRETVLDHAKLASRARALLPALAPWLSGEFEGAVRIEHAARSALRLEMDCGEGISKGDAVTAKIEAGWFQVERKLEALQNGSEGLAFFARTSDGDVVKIYCEEAE